MRVQHVNRPGPHLTFPVSLPKLKNQGIVHNESPAGWGVDRAFVRCREESQFHRLRPVVTRREHTAVPCYNTPVKPKRAVFRLYPLARICGRQRYKRGANWPTEPVAGLTPVRLARGRRNAQILGGKGKSENTT